MEKIVLKSVTIADGTEEYKADILINNGIIEKIADNIEAKESRIVSGNNLAVFPGLFDMHVHFRDPGLTYKEDIDTGCKAALAGGITGVLCMPNTKPPVDNSDTVNYILGKSENTGVEVCVTGCITKNMDSTELCDFDTLKEAGIKALSDDGKPVKNAELMRQALAETNKNGLIITSHCEDMNIIGNGIINKGKISEQLGVCGMDRASEDSVTAREIALAACENARIHIAHVSTEGSVQLIRDAKKRGVKVTAETCPHYFTYTDDKLLTKDADYRMNPPLREERDRKAVLEALLDGTLDCIVTDHAPHSSEEKSDFEKAPNGVVGLETSLSVVLTKLYHTGEMDLNGIVKCMSVNPRKILGLKPVLLKVGEEANLAVVDLEKEWTVLPEKLHSKSRNTVFKGENLKGKTIMTISCGEIRFEDK